MIELSIDRTHRLVMVRFVDRLEAEDFARIDAVLGRLPDAEALRCIVDLSDVADVATTSPDLVARARGKPALPTVYKVFVAPSDVSFGIGRQFSTHRDLSGHAGPRIVRSLDEALERLGVSDPRFEPLT
jgi:hypothetical protein